MARAWEALAQTPTIATPFNGAVWQSAAWKTQNAGDRLRLLTIHRAGELIGVLPLRLSRERGLLTPGAAVTDYLDPLISSDAEHACWRAVLSFLTSVWDQSVVEFTLHNLRESASCRRVLPSVAEAIGFTCEEKVVEYAPAIRLPATWEGFLAALDPHERKESRRKLNKAEGRGGARLQACDREEQIAPSLERTLRFMEICGGQKGDAVKRFIRPLLAAAAPAMIRTKQLDLLTLMIHEEPACCLLQFRSSRGPMLYNCGYDPAQREWSPGVVAVMLAIRDAIAAGAAEYDLLRGQEAYKYKLGAVDRPLFRLTFRRK